MRLLVSVRSADEARAAVRGGADIVDAKEPRAGALAPVGPDVLTAIERAVPSDLPLSVALGDIGSGPEAANAVASLALAPRSGGFYVKFALATGAESVYEVTRAAVAAARAHSAEPEIVVAACVDRLARMEFDLREIIEGGADAGAFGILLDTAEKSGRSLLDYCDVGTLTEFTVRAHALRLHVALAGSIGARELPQLRESGADIVGVRGAVCTGGRNGDLDAERIILFRTDLTSGPVEGPEVVRTVRSLSLRTGTLL